MKRPLALLALALTAGGCDGKSSAGPAAGLRGARSYPVEIAPVATRSVDVLFDAAGSLEAEEEVLVVARVPGTVEDVAFKEGDAVTPETVLATIDPARYALGVARAKAARDRSEADRREAEVAYARRKALHEKNPGWVSEEEVTNYEAVLAKAAAALAEAKASLDLAEQDLRESRVRPLRPGTINEKLVRTGQFVDRGVPLARLFDTRRLRLRFRLTESESARLGPAPAVTFRARSFPGRDFPAALYHVSQQADASTRMVDCLAWVENPDGTLRPGFFAEVRVKVATREGAAVVPEAAILPTERGFLAYVVEGDVARERHPTLGLHTQDGFVEVLDGLRPGEALVVRGAHVLKEGAKVEVVRP